MALKYKPQHRRLVFIDQQISAGGFPNCYRMSKEWEVSAKTIQRDIDFLRDELEAPIQYSAKRRGFFYTERTWRLPAIQLSEGDLFSIAIAEKVLQQYENTPLRASLNTIFEKLRQSLPGKVSATEDWLSPRVSVRLVPSTIVDKAAWVGVMAALRENRRLSVMYRTPGYSTSISLVLSPYHLVGYSGEWYLIASSRNSVEPKTFALSRMASVVTLAERFVMPEGFDAQSYWKDSLGIFRGEKRVTVRLRFSAEQATYVAERIWMDGQRLNRLRTGEAVLSFRVSHLYEVKRWVLSWGEDVKVLAPKELVEDVRQALHTAYRLYR